MLPVIAQPRVAIPGEKQRAVEVDDGRPLGDQHAPGPWTSEVPTMQPTMMSSPRRARLGGERQRLGQAAGLVELDVDGVVAPGEARERGTVMQRFVGADRAPRAGAEPSAASSPAGKGCSISATPTSAQAAMLRVERVGAPAFVGVDDEAGARGAPSRTARMRAASSAVPSLTLRSGRPACAAAAARIASGSPSDRV